jgi:HEPN domain-containing protein
MSAARIDENDAPRWWRFAQEDLIEAEAILEREGSFPRHACLLAQQAAEKALKTVLVFIGIDFPRSHDLDGLRNLIPLDWRVAAEFPDLVELTQWAVESRYPGDWFEPTEDQATFALSLAEAILGAIEADLRNRGQNVDNWF